MQIRLCLSRPVAKILYEEVFSELQEGKRDRGAPRKRYKDQLKRHLAQAGISHQSWQQEASDRDSCRSSVKKTSCEFETEMHKATKEKRRRQKERAAPLPSSSQTFVCPKCGRGCVCIMNRSLQTPTSMQELTIDLPNNLLL